MFPSAPSTGQSREYSSATENGIVPKFGHFYPNGNRAIHKSHSRLPEKKKERDRQTEITTLLRQCETGPNPKSLPFQYKRIVFVYRCIGLPTIKEPIWPSTLVCFQHCRRISRAGANIYTLELLSPSTTYRLLQQSQGGPIRMEHQ